MNAFIGGIRKIDNSYYLSFYWDNGNTDYDDVIDLDEIKFGTKEITITSTVHGRKTFTFEIEKIRNMLVLFLLNKKLGI